eukprot:6431604-Prymnesium_polylepis.2
MAHVGRIAHHRFGSGMVTHQRDIASSDAEGEAPVGLPRRGVRPPVRAVPRCGETRPSAATTIDPAAAHAPTIRGINKI